MSGPISSKFPNPVDEPPGPPLNKTKYAKIRGVKSHSKPNKAAMVHKQS